MTPTEAAPHPRLAPTAVGSVVVSPAPLPPPAPGRGPRLVLLASLAVGVALRLLAFASDRPLWIDEAMIALNLSDRPVGRLFEPLDRNQTAPVAFLLAGNLCVTLFGPTEHAVRLPAFVGSVLGLLVFAAAAGRLLPTWPARFAVLLFAVSPTVVNYAAEVKQYSTDAAATAALLALAAPLLRTPTVRGLLLLAAGGAAAVWVSHPAVFVLAAAGVVLFVRALFTKRHRLLLVCTGLLWAASFAAVWWVNVRHASGNEYLEGYWAGQMMPRSPEALPWVIERTVDFFRSAGGYGGEVFRASGLAAVLAAAGAVLLWRGGRRAELALLGGVFAVTLLAAAAGKYPFSGRLLLFLVPAGVLLLAAGAGGVVAAVWRKSRLAAGVLAAAVALAPAVEAVHQLRHPHRTEDVPACLEFVRAHWQPGDRVYVYNGATDVGAGPAFEFYTRRERFPDGSVTLGGVYRGDPRGYQAEVNELGRSPGRVWVLFSHEHGDEQTWVRAYFDAAAGRGDEFRGTDAAVFGYTMR